MRRRKLKHNCLCLSSVGCYVYLNCFDVIKMYFQWEKLVSNRTRVGKRLAMMYVKRTTSHFLFFTMCFPLDIHQLAVRLGSTYEKRFRLYFIAHIQFNFSVFTKKKKNSLKLCVTKRNHLLNFFFRFTYVRKKKRKNSQKSFIFRASESVLKLWRKKTLQ